MERILANSVPCAAESSSVLVPSWTDELELPLSREATRDTLLLTLVLDMPLEGMLT